MITSWSVSICQKYLVISLHLDKFGTRRCLICLWNGKIHIRKFLRNDCFINKPTKCFTNIMKYNKRLRIVNSSRLLINIDKLLNATSYYPYILYTLFVSFLFIHLVIHTCRLRVPRTWPFSRTTPIRPLRRVLKSVGWRVDTLWSSVYVSKKQPLLSTMSKIVWALRIVVSASYLTIFIISC